MTHYVCEQDGYRIAEWAVNLPSGAAATLVCDDHKDEGASYVMNRWGVREVLFSRIALVAGRSDVRTSGDRE